MLAAEAFAVGLIVGIAGALAFDTGALVLWAARALFRSAGRRK